MSQQQNNNSSSGAYRGAATSRSNSGDRRSPLGPVHQHSYLQQQQHQQPYYTSPATRPMQLPSYVPFSHPPLLSQIQSQSHHHVGHPPRHHVDPGAYPTTPNPAPAVHLHQHHLHVAGGGGQSPPPPFSSTAPLINFLNVPTGTYYGASSASSSPGGGRISHRGSGPLLNGSRSLGDGDSGSANSTPITGRSPSSCYNGYRDFPSPNNASTSSLGGGDTFGEIESFLPQNSVNAGIPTSATPTTNETPSNPTTSISPVRTTPARRSQKPVREKRVLGRKVEGTWTQILPVTSEEEKQQKAEAKLKQEQADDDDGGDESAAEDENDPSVTATMPQQPNPVPIVHSGPDRRFGHIAVVRPSTNQMVIFGGRQTGLCFDDMWVADLTSVKPTETTTTSTTTSSNSNEATVQWTQIKKPEGEGVVWPSPRAGHTAVMTEDEELLMFGGGTETDFYGELFSYNFTTAKWTLLKDFDTNTKRRNYDLQVKPRKGHTAVWDPKQQSMFVYGGLLCLDQPLKDSTVWKYERGTNSWCPMPQPKSVPQDRAYHVAGFDETTSSMLVFGGRSIRETPTYPFLGDLHSFNTKTGVWTNIEATGPEAPPPRMCAASTFYNGRFFVSHGGHTRYLNDSYEFDPKREKWSKSTETPSPLTRPTVVIHDNTLTLFGGCDHEIFSNDCHQLSLAEPSLFDLCSEWLNDGKHIPSEEAAPPAARIPTTPETPQFRRPTVVHGVMEYLSMPPPLTLGQSVPASASATPRGSGGAGFSHSPTVSPPPRQHHSREASLGTPASPMLQALQIFTTNTTVTAATLSPEGADEISFPGFSRHTAVNGISPPLHSHSSISSSVPRRPLLRSAVFQQQQQQQQREEADVNATDLVAAAAATPLPANVLKKAQRLLKAQGVLPPPSIHPRDLHVPTQPFF